MNHSRRSRRVSAAVVGLVLVAALVLSTLGGCSLLGWTKPPAPAPAPEPSPNPSPTPTPPPVGKVVKVKSTFPLPAMIEVPLNAGVVIAFEAPVDPASVAKGAAFAPEMAGTWEAYGSKDRVAFRAGAAWQPLTTYTLTLTSVRGEDGSALAEPFTLAFRTGAGLVGYPSALSALPAPAWSPDGKRLAFLAPPDPDVGSGDAGPASYAIESYALNLVTLGKREVTRLTNSADRWQSPAFTAAGRTVVYASAVAPASGGKYNPDEVWAVKALSEAGLPVTQPVPKALVHAADFNRPSWLAAYPSPDGHLLAVVGNYGGADSHSDVIQNLFIADATGKRLRDVGSTGGTQYFLGWVGSGRFLFLETFEQKNNSHYFAYDLREADAATGQTHTLLTDGPVVGFAGGGISADGSLIAVNTWKAYDTGRTIAHMPIGLIVIRKDAKAAGGYSVKAVELPGAVGWAVPSPDGRQVVFSSDDRGYWDLWLLDVATMATTRLTSGADGVDAVTPAWSPDGKLIAFVQRNKNGTDLKLVRPDTKEVLDYWQGR
ncbi:MAG: TolB family protein [Bacillota bacterium]